MTEVRRSCESAAGPIIGDMSLNEVAFLIWKHTKFKARGAAKVPVSLAVPRLSKANDTRNTYMGWHLIAKVEGLAQFLGAL